MLFYQSVIQSVIVFCCTAWANGLTIENSNKINRITKSASRITGCKLQDLMLIYEAALLVKLKQIQFDNTHPLHTFLDSNKSGRLRQHRCCKNRLRISFLPSAISCFNRNFTR